MTANERFVARILETSAAGYAGMATGLLLERHPEVAQRYAPDAFSKWKGQLRQWLLELSAAIDVGRPALFEGRVRWTRRAFRARQAREEEIGMALKALRDALVERLPEGSAGEVGPVLEAALAVLSGPVEPEQAGLDPDRAEDRLALGYLETILGGDPRGAIERILAEIDGGMSVMDAYLRVLLPVQREAGRMWHAAELSIAEEHLVTQTTQRTMALLCERSRPASRNGKTVLSACVAGNVHDVGIRILSDFFDMAGWRAVCLGADLPSDEIVRSVQYFDVDLAALAATLNPQLKALARTIERIRALERREVKIIVGGQALDEAPELWRRLGADGYTSALEEVVPLARRLIGLE